VSAEYTVVDLTRIPDACGGDEVVIIGRDGAEHVSVSDVAGYLGMSPLMCLLGLRDIPYRYLSLDATSDMERAA
jgi:alanine racemase